MENEQLDSEMYKWIDVLLNMDVAENEDEWQMLEEMDSHEKASEEDGEE